MTTHVEEYLIPRRLEEVLALIQVLGLDEEFTRRSETSLERDLQGKPRSAQNWKELAKQHPEFFIKSTSNTIFLYRSSPVMLAREMPMVAACHFLSNSSKSC